MYDQGSKMCDSAEMEIRKDSVIERLHRDKTSLESRLKDVNYAIELLNKNPNVAEVLRALSKVTHL